jgi:hypothetical protein
LVCKLIGDPRSDRKVTLDLSLVKTMFRVLIAKVADFSRLGAPQRIPLFIHIPPFSAFQLVVVLAEVGFIFALVSLRPVEDTPHTFAIEDLAWIDERASVDRSGSKAASHPGTVGYGRAPATRLDIIFTCSQVFLFPRFNLTAAELADVYKYAM